MRILFLTTHFNTGGITSYLLTLSRSFVKKGHEVFIASSGGDRVQEVEAVGVKHITLNIRTKSELSLKIHQSRRVLQCFLKTASIDILHSQTRVTQVLGTMIAKNRKIPHVTTCHGFFKPRLSRKIFPCWGDAVIAISPQVKEHLRADLGVKDHKIFFVPHGIDMDRVSRDSQWIMHKRAELGLKEGPIIGVVARLSDVKGLDVLINAMKHVLEQQPLAHLVIAGDGKEKKALQSLVRSLGLDDNVLFVSAVDRLDDILSVFDVFAMPSRQEGLGLSVMEAQACGLAVVATRVGGLVYLIKDGQTGILVEPENPHALAQALVDLLAHPDKAKEMGQRAKDVMGQSFSLDNMVESTLKIYQDLTHEKNPRL